MPPPDNARPASKGGARPAQQDASSSSEAALQQCEELEAAIAELRHSYEQYFLGMERQAPIRAHEDLKKRMLKLKGAFIRSTSVKFRVQSLHNKFLTYERLWARTLQEIEAGTYRRDLAKARRRAGTKPAGATGQKGVVEIPEEVDDMDFEEIEELTGRRPINEPKLASEYMAEQQGPAGTPFRGSPAVAPVAAQPAGAPRGTPAGLVPPKQSAPAVSPVSGLPSIAPVGTPAAGRPAVPPGMATKAPAAAPQQPARPAAPAAAAAPRPAAAGPGGGMSDDKLRAVYDAYVTAKRRCQEDTSKLSYESVAATLRKQVPELLKQHNAKAVEFKVVIKDGKASLKAVPK
ncbi:hypothetical protein D7W82_30845 [Corallococcus sp. CA049B]|uniref:MXAN_5187 C-terminal domain-containing protein n=1 Tax=Corallococcus sp. CA049B TaxID=2316730 RepID=UPI000EA0E747|nr:MXAN_5187 C-terminal domain-containing protein [Corallococcus sp. CA049B]NOJ92276.1 hypothetical protein [Corallococcus coralloides]RKG79431.1 hypothetical protein D7W82_30845 [Corallococcus sp. CA049B]